MPLSLASCTGQGKRVGALVLVAVLGLAAGCGGGRAGETEGPPRPEATLALSGCYVTVHIFAVDRSRLAAALPPHFQLGTYAGPASGPLVAWGLSCNSIATPAGGGGRARMVLIGAQILNPSGPQGGQAPATFDHYLLYAHADRRWLVDRLRAVGLPAEWVPGIAFRRARQTVLRVPWRRGHYALRVRATSTEAPHDHDDSFWHSGPHGVSRLELRLFRATDRNCSPCGATGAAAAPGSPLARLLGARSLGVQVAFDHNRIARGEATLWRPGRLDFAAARPGGFVGVVGVTVDRDLVARTRRSATPVPAVRGVLVTKVLPGQPAAKAGVRAGRPAPAGLGLPPGQRIGGDVILALNGRPVASFSGFAAAVTQLPPGSLAFLTVLRDGHRLRIAVTVASKA